MLLFTNPYKETHFSLVSKKEAEEPHAISKCEMKTTCKQKIIRSIIAMFVPAIA